ncbi:MAG: 2-amino-4-hydroxy-6-hydroxymethyldihydropteridine diphosphokinase [Chloroflexota bacterium]|nr:2-amino-4-hydroxy-6-hydroxymethyldihydropteridine diphosphokinase [Chloroflexota bacterium]
MFPIINIGPFAIQTSGFILIAALFMGIWIMGYFSKNLGTNGEVIENSILLGLIVGLISARAGFILQNPTALAGNPFAVFSLTPSMLNASFGIFVGVVTAFIFGQKKHLPLWPTLDTLTPLLILVFAGIHLSNFANGNGYGLPTDLPWGIQLWNETRHPVNLYVLVLISAYFIRTALHTKIFKNTGFIRSGTLFSLTLGVIGFITLISRSFVEEKVLIGSFDSWQLMGFALLVFGMAMIYHKGYKNQKHISVFISLGSNQDAEKNLGKAIDQIKASFKIRKSSNVYKTKDVISEDALSTFFNQVIEIDTDLSYIDLRTKLKAIERGFGRQQGNKKSVPLDLDILTYDNDVFYFHGKQIPDPNLIQYKYIVVPLGEIAPDFRHPASGVGVEDIIAQLSDKNAIQKLKEVENGFTT